MSLDSLKEDIVANGYEDVVVFENPDYADAFIGISTDGRAVYSYDDMIACLMEEDGMTEEDAVDFIEFNTVRSLPYYGNSPIIVRPLVR